MLKINRNGRATTLSKALLTAGLLGGAALLSSPAEAGQIPTNSCSFGSDLTHSPCSSYNWAGVPDPNYDYMQLDDKILRLNWLGTNLGTTSGTIDFTQNLQNWTVTLDLQPDTVVPSTLGFAYWLSIDPILGAGKQFATVKLDSNCNNDPYCQVDKAINGNPTLTSVNGGNVGPALITGTTIYVENTFFTTGPNATMGAIVNNYTQTTTQTPGPLPLLGAGAAFGFSRRIRSRIKAARLV